MVKHSHKHTPKPCGKSSKRTETVTDAEGGPTSYYIMDYEWYNTQIHVCEGGWANSFENTLYIFNLTNFFLDTVLSSFITKYENINFLSNAKISCRQAPGIWSWLLLLKSSWRSLSDECWLYWHADYGVGSPQGLERVCCKLVWVSVDDKKKGTPSEGSHCKKRKEKKKHDLELLSLKNSG